MKYLEKKVNIEKVQMIMYKEILSFDEARIYLDVSQSLLYKLTSKKEIPFSKPNGGKLYFKKKDLDNWMLKNSSNSKELLEAEILKHIQSNGKETN